jgi:hypothetical protein
MDFKMKMLKTIVAIMALILIVGTASALTISISPVIARDNNNLVCSTDSNPGAFVYKWLLNNNYKASGQTLVSSLTNVGDNWVCKVFLPATSQTSEIYVGEASRQISANNIPTAPVITLSPGPYYPTSLIAATAVSTDADNDALTYEYSYQRAGVVISSLNALNCNSLCNAGDTITLFARAYDGSDYSAQSSITFAISAISGSTVIDSTINGIVYSGTGTYNNIAGIINSVINASIVSGPVISIDSSTIQSSTVMNSILSLSNVLDGSAVIDSTCINSTIDPSTVMNSNVSNSNINNSMINSAKASNSNVANSNVFNTIIENAIIANNVISSGTILATNGSVYNATASGSLNLIDLINLPPTAYIKSPANASTFTNGTSVSFISDSRDMNLGTLLNDSLAYLWDFGDNSTASTENATHTYPAAGTYNVMLNVTDKFNATSAASITVNIGPASVPFSYCPINSASSDIVISNIKNLDSIENKEFSPLDEFKIRINVQNNADTTKTAYVKAVIVYNNAVIKDTEDSQEVKLSSGSTKTVELNISIPVDMKQGDYQVYVKVYDDNNRTDCGIETIPFSIVRDDHSLSLVDWQFSPSSEVSCGDLLTWTGKIANLGEEDETKVKIIYEDDLKNKFEETVTNLDWGTESSDISFYIKIPTNLTDAKYNSKIKLFYDNYNTDSYGKNTPFSYTFSVSGCKASASAVSFSTATSTTTTAAAQEGLISNTKGFINQNWKTLLIGIELAVVIIVVLKILLISRLI